MSNYYSTDEINSLGLKEVGKNVKLSNKCVIDDPGNVIIKDNSRIDDFTILTGDVFVGKNVHIGPFCFLSGKNGIVLDNFSGLSARVSIYTSSEDYYSGQLSNPTIPPEYKSLIQGKVEISEHCIIGSGSVILPDCKIGFGSSVGALSLVNKSLKMGKVYAGIPVEVIGQRNTKKIRKLASDYLNN
jgi:acetyltransferase-like isoleucine patch superfamily enzyme